MSSTQVETTNREIIVTRLLDAPRARVFKAWTEQQHVAHWWGPNGFTITTAKMDVRPDGEWVFVMHGPDGRDYNNRIVYIEVQPPERLVYEHPAETGEGVQFESTVTFTEKDGKTEVTMRMVFPSAQELQRVAKEFGAIEGANETFGRLAAYAANM